MPEVVVCALDLANTPKVDDEFITSLQGDIRQGVKETLEDGAFNDGFSWDGFTIPPEQTLYMIIAVDFIPMFTKVRGAAARHFFGLSRVSRAAASFVLAQALLTMPEMASVPPLLDAERQRKGFEPPVDNTILLATFIQHIKVNEIPLTTH